MKRKIMKVGNDYQIMNDDESGTITVRDAESFLALALFEDICEYRKGNKELKDQIALETMALNALAASQR
ncbi:hypothetical protein B5F53_18550 [Blautia sp. An249]|uniref:hypothetical protein n=1 Tax=Blautia sp. An249 TaxID=1965603 RepID=UPI000B3A0D4E|nr:hypothetical protein [Blautia sp. An249]OUO75189.1 hypothetical protein B5F53_18550 [Blautia sp. An249]